MEDDGVQTIGTIHVLNINYTQIGGDVFFHKQVSNAKIEIYIMHFKKIQKFIHCFPYCEYL